MCVLGLDPNTKKKVIKRREYKIHRMAVDSFSIDWT